MSNSQLNLTDEERQLLAHLIDHALKEKRVEERRTRTDSFRDILVHQEHLLEGLLEKLDQPALA